MQEFTLGYTKDHPIILNGQIVQVDFNMTDEELKTALKPIRDELFSLFGVEFKDIRIDRQYNGYSPYGADRVAPCPTSLPHLKLYPSRWELGPNATQQNIPQQI